MDQPGVYFTLDVPFVSIVGLYTNVLEGPGVISTQGGKYPSLAGGQLDFMRAELQRIAPARKAGERGRASRHHRLPPPVSRPCSSGVPRSGEVRPFGCPYRVAAAGFWLLP